MFHGLEVVKQPQQTTRSLEKPAMIIKKPWKREEESKREKDRVDRFRGGVGGVTGVRLEPVSGDGKGELLQQCNIWPYCPLQPNSKARRPSAVQ